MSNTTWFEKVFGRAPKPTPPLTYWAVAEFDWNLFRDDIDYVVDALVPAVLYPTPEAAIAAIEKDRDERNADTQSVMAISKKRDEVSGATTWHYRYGINDYGPFTSSAEMDAHIAKEHLEPPYTWEAPDSERPYYRAVLLQETYKPYGATEPYTDIHHEIRVYPVTVCRDSRD